MTPEAEWTIDAPLVERLVAAQHPECLGTLTDAGSGWDNAMFRLGSGCAVRLPRRALAVPLIEKELKWLPLLGPLLPLPVPLPLHRGQPSSEFPWPWILQPWLPGRTADREPVSGDQGPVLAAFLRALHRPAPPEAPLNPYRGVPLAERADALRTRMDRLADAGVALDPVVQRVWHQGVEATMDVEPTWIHADLHPRNVLVTEGRLTGILDWGDLCVGDRAVDLSALWMLWGDSRAQLSALEAYGGVSEATLRRSLGWAVVFGVMFLEAGLGGEPVPTALGHQILGRVVEFCRAQGTKNSGGTGQVRGGRDDKPREVVERQP